jgi:hypothetical protein
MPVVNMPPMLRELFASLDSRVRKLEQSQSFQAPSLTANPSPLRNGMIWYRSDLKRYLTYDNNVVRAIGEMRWYGDFQDTTTQTLGSTASVYPVAIGTTNASFGVSITSSNRITYANPGIYFLNFSMQLESLDTSAANEAYVWIRQNGTDTPASMGRLSINSKHSGVNGSSVASWSYTITTTAANEYVQFYWTAQSTQVQITTDPLTASPPIPQSPGFVCTTFQMAW